MISSLRARNKDRYHKGFTLVELILVISIIGISFSLVLSNLGSSQFWKQEGGVRKLNELIKFLHHQSIAEQIPYRLEFDLEKRSYRAGTVRSYGSSADSSLNDRIFGSDDSDNDIAPSPEYPSLYKPTVLPEDVRVSWIRTMRGDTSFSQGGYPFIDFSPQGYSEFAVIHLTLANDAPFTIVINPFTGLTQTYKEHREFEWNHGNK